MNATCSEERRDPATKGATTDGPAKLFVQLHEREAGTWHDSVLFGKISYKVLF
jgi:hypothetical protein